MKDKKQLSKDLLNTILEEIVVASYSYEDKHGKHPDPDIHSASMSAIRQMLAIKAYEIVCRTHNLPMSAKDFSHACR